MTFRLFGIGQNSGEKSEWKGKWEDYVQIKCTAKSRPWVFRGSLQKYINTTCHYYATRPEKKLSIHMQIQPLNLSSRHEYNFSGRPQTLASLRIKRNNFRDWIVESGRSRRHRFSRPDPIGFVRLEALVACAQAALTIQHKASLKRTLITTFYIFCFSCSRLRQPTVENKLNVVFVFDWYWGLQGCSYHGWILTLTLFLHPHDTSWNAPNAAMIQLSSHIQIAGLLLIGSIAASLRPKRTLTVEWVMTCAYMLRIFLDMCIKAILYIS